MELNWKFNSEWHKPGVYVSFPAYVHIQYSISICLSLCECAMVLHSTCCSRIMQFHWAGVTLLHKGIHSVRQTEGISPSKQTHQRLFPIATSKGAHCRRLTTLRSKPISTDPLLQKQLLLNSVLHVYLTDFFTPPIFFSTCHAKAEAKSHSLRKIV